MILKLQFYVERSVTRTMLELKVAQFSKVSQKVNPSSFYLKSGDFEIAKSATTKNFRLLL